MAPIVCLCTSNWLVAEQRLEFTCHESRPLFLLPYRAASEERGCPPGLLRCSRGASVYKLLVFFFIKIHIEYR